MVGFAVRKLAAAVVAVVVLVALLLSLLSPGNSGVVFGKVPAQKPGVSDTLAEDGRIGKVIDTQGVVSIKPVMHERWSPVRSQLLVRPGDWVRTDVRGANAVEIRLVRHTGLILGPGTLVELVKPTQVRLLQGELEVAAPPGDSTFEVVGPHQQKVTVKGTQRLRVDREKERLVHVAKEPLWLKGFKGSVATEALGSLVATVDGRNVPLSVGYHKVNVDVRDQIARTTIEESFVNHTNGQLEGVFYFPLPQDASISGFGMWIGNNLVEADVVEKQRAREIYEIILSEKRDPGLLEWSGGNIFKARVWPIFPNSEKRVKITYTQVLPLKGNRYRYSYGLQSEMLQQHPLRELAIDVKVSSAVPLKGVSSPTHEARIDCTAHSAHVEFTAQEYTPTRDFEVVIEADGKQSNVVMIPHRRGEDGYFMLQLLPSVSGEPEERDVLPDGRPLQLLILADTSASMDAGQRATQEAVLAALLGSLTPKDTVNVAGCDVDCDWVFEKPVPADGDHIAAARQFLARRSSLGWTDLDKAFASAFQQSGPNTQVIYLGDGIVTANGDSDPAAFVKRLRRLYAGKSGTCHAVALGSSFEPAVLKAISSLGGGSFRRVTGGEHGPQAVALELLSEIAQPPLRDLKVEFQGLRTARVYPEQLPNVPAGAQQILLGRYLPEGEVQQGEVIVTGMQGDQPVRFRVPVSLKDAEKGNSFIPRLWARMHLDHLLDLGASDTLRDEIIALSEEYQIITPYTSFLVLESDADRERFQVKRRFQMRDGEKFFAGGRDNANYELTQKQMKRAGNWRLGLRRMVLKQLAGLGRDARVFQAQGQEPHGMFLGRSGSFAGGGSGPTPVLAPVSESAPAGAPWGFDESGAVRDAAEMPTAPPPINGELGAKDATSPADDSKLGDEREQRGESLEEARRSRADELPGKESETDAETYEKAPRRELAAADNKKLDYLQRHAKDGPFVQDELKSLTVNGAMPFGGEQGQPYGWSKQGCLACPGSRQPVQFLDNIFPAFAALTGAETERKSTWPTAAQKLSGSLLRTPKLARMTGGIEIVRRSEYFDVRWGELTSRSGKLEIYSPTAWLTRSRDDGTQTLIHWCDGKERGVMTRAFQLGRIRACTPEDLRRAPLDLSDYSLMSLEQTYQGYSATVEVPAEDRALLVLRLPSMADFEMRVLIDTSRQVILSVESRAGGKVASAVKFDDFVEAAGSWWAKRIDHFDEKGRLLFRITQTIKPLEAEALDRAFQKELADRDEVQFLRQPLPHVTDAKRALDAGKATFDDRMVLVEHFMGSQQWTRAQEHLGQAERLAQGKPGMRWVRDAFLSISRRHEELRKRLLEEASRLVKAAGKDATPDELFLADHLVGQSAAFLQANEMLALLENLRPVYERQPAHRRAMKRWQQQRASYLQQAGQTDAALRLQKELATEYPHDYSLQQNYAQALVNQGDYDAAYAWLNRVLDKDARWLPGEEESLRNSYAQWLLGQGRYPELVEYLAEWIKRDPESITPYQQYLSALVWTDQVDGANKLIGRWLQEGEVPGELTPPAAARLQAAVNQALGQGYNLYTNRIEERWLAPLGRAALFFARHPSQGQIADSIMDHWQFRQSDECRRVRRAIAAVLATDLERLPADQIQRFVVWISANDPAIEPARWQQLSAGLRKRWATEMKPEIRNQLGQTLVQILRGHADVAELLAFLRLQWREGPEPYRLAYAGQLFDSLLGQPWSLEREDEAFRLLEKQSDAKEPGWRLLAQVSALHRLTDAMVDARLNARMQTVEHQEKLSRTELRLKREDNLRLAREQFADRLRAEEPKHALALARWLTSERLYLDTLLDRDLKKVAAECWQLVGERPPAVESPDEEPAPQRLLEDVLRYRALTTLANLAARSNADPALVERLLKYFDQGIAGEGKSGHWKGMKYRLLVALDRPKDLEKALRQWIDAGDADSGWRLSLGYVLAEQGRIGEAVTMFEAVQAKDELGPAAYRTLADWYLVLNRRELHEQALVLAYKTMDEYRLGRFLMARLYPYQRNDNQVPPELDKEVLLVFKALFEKSSYPQNYLGQVQQFYQATHDFRLLAWLPDAVVGHSEGQVYPFLQSMQGVLTEVRDEATADQIVEQLARARTHAKTTIDRRALDLLELLVERRAAEVQNQPGPHADKALAAMERAFRREWSAGEPPLMADLLAGLGAISQPSLAKEQLRELEILHQRSAEGSFERLQLAHRLATTLWYYSRGKEAVDLLGAALTEFEKANGGVLPVTAHDALSTLVSYLENGRDFAVGEKLLLTQLGHPVHEQQGLWLTQRLYQLYQNALQQDGKTSLGEGLALYRALERKLRDGLGTHDVNHRYALMNDLCGVYRVAQGRKLDGVLDDLHGFAFSQLPRVLKQQTSNYPSVVSQVAQTVHDLAGPQEGVAFLVERVETEPGWFRFNNQDGWSQHGWSLAYWRSEAKVLDADISGRLLKLVTTELRRDLESGQQRNRSMYHRQNSYFWAEQEEAFAKTAEEVLARRSGSGATVKYIADYLYWGLNRTGRAIDVLAAAHRRKILDDAGQSQLVDYLQRHDRYGESILLLGPLVGRAPENLQYRILLMHAYARTADRDRLGALLKETDAFFHEKGRWHEGVIASLASSCLDNNFYEQAVAYYQEAIPLHQRSAPRRGIGDGTLSSYYSQLARAHAALHKTAEAVDAASGAIVSWGANQSNRAQALEALKQVLRDAPDLETYVAHLDARSAETGLQNPIVRKAVGQAYFARELYGPAIAQLRLAAALQPNDTETHQLLVACHDKQGDKEGAVRQLLQSVQLSRRDINLYRDLGHRLESLERPGEVERAYTSIVEVLPGESESHALLAEIRQQQDRWPEAIVQWEQVAKLRALEPTGLLKLTAAEIHERQWDKAAETLRQLGAKTWPARFGDVPGQVWQLKQEVEQGRRKSAGASPGLE